MSIKCQLSSEDEDQWENQGGFFQFPGDIEQCAQIDFSNTQGEICVDLLFSEYTETCRDCMQDQVQCITDFCASDCLECFSPVNIECSTLPITDCSPPRCTLPNNDKYADSLCQNCIVNNCNQDFRDCSGYSAEFCTICVNPADDDGGNLPAIIGGGAAGVFVLAFALFAYVRLKKFKRKEFKPTSPGYMAKLVGEDKKKNSGSGDYAYSAPIQVGASKPKKLPPGLGYTQPPRPVEQSYDAEEYVVDEGTEYEQFIVAYGFEAENVDELDADIGTPVICLSKVDDNWFMVQAVNGARGLIPTDFLREPEDEERLPMSSFGLGGQVTQQQTATFVSPTGSVKQQKITVVKRDDDVDQEDEEPDF